MHGARLSGLLLVDKPEGPTSHDVVARVRRALGGVRVGHAGTLDPFATGLLVLCVGRATRLAEYLLPLPKRYRATLRLGVRTDTHDRTGTVTARDGSWVLLGREAIEDALRAQASRTEQVVPVYSAKKRDGVRLYDAARRGSVVEPPTARVRIYRIECLDVRGPDVTFEVECSAGTYVRAIARDVGEDLGVGAHLVALRRLEVGAFRVEDACPPDALDDAARLRAALRPPEDAVAHLPRWALPPAEARRFAAGQAVPAAAGLDPDLPIAVFAGDRVIGIGRAEGGRLRPEKVLVPAGAP